MDEKLKHKLTTKVEETELEVAQRELKNVRYALDEAAIVAITDRTGKITHVNDKFCQISKYSREELLGQDHRIVNSGYHSKEFFQKMWKTISSGKIWHEIIRNRAKDGTYYWVNTTIVPFLDSSGKPYEYVAIRYEMTQQKLQEEQLRIYAKRLEISNRELQDFASIAAHDLQEPLRKIRAFGDRLRVKCGASISEQGQDYLERMLNSAERMQTLISDLLTFSRVQTRAQPFVKTDLEKIVEGVLSDLELSIEQTQGKVEIRPLPTIEADPMQMRQLFQNLIGNALKFHRPNLPPVVTVQSKVVGSMCELVITDNGIGFDEKYLDRIFTIFQRLHGRQQYQGTGIGLAVCRRIVERHSGIITAKSKISEGSQFIIRLPLKQELKGDEYNG